MGERQGWLLEPTFRRAVKVVAGDDRLTSDGGAILLREADHRLGLVESLAARMHDPRRPDLIRYTLLELLRQRLYALGLGYSAQDDLDRLCHDPALKLAVWDRYGEETAEERLSSQPTQSRLIDILAHHRGNREAVRDALGDWLHRWVRATGADRRVRQATIDIDSFPIEVFGRQEGAAYNGYHQAVTYHPLVASFCAGGHYDSAKDGCRLGNGFLHALLRQGNVHTADGIRRFLRLSSSGNHGLNFCQGTVAEMFKDPGKAMIPVIEEFAATGRIFMVHFRNIRGGYLDFQEVFPDEGDVDMFEAIKAYQRGGYAGPLCPDHVPVSDLDENRERFMSFALGYTRGLLQAAGVSSAPHH